MGVPDGFCKGCQKNCCGDLSLPPMVFGPDYELLVAGLGAATAGDSIQVINNERYLKRCSEGAGGCIFFDNHKRCTIYEYRPMDCRLFPFDVIKRADGSLRLVVVGFCPRELAINQAMVDAARKIVKQLKDTGCLEEYAAVHLAEVANGNYCNLPACFDAEV